MKTQCEKNGLQYEILVQDSAKERFLRQISASQNPFQDFGRSFVIMKKTPEQSPESQTSEPTVGAANPSPSEIQTENNDASLAAANPSQNAEDESNPSLGMPLVAGKVAAGATKAIIAGKMATGFTKAVMAKGAATGAVLGGLGAKTAIAKTAVAGTAIKAAAIGTAAKTSLALAGLGTKLKANKLLFTLGAPQPDGDNKPLLPMLPTPEPAPSPFADWFTRLSAPNPNPVLGAPNPLLGAPKSTTNSDSSKTPEATTTTKPFFPLGPVQPAYLIENR